MALGFAVVDNAPNYVKAWEPLKEKEKLDGDCLWYSVKEAAGPAIAASLAVNAVSNRLFFLRPISALCYAGTAFYAVHWSAKETQKLNKTRGYTHATLSQRIAAANSKYVDARYLLPVKNACRPVLESTKTFLKEKDPVVQREALRKYMRNVGEWTSTKACALIDYCLELVAEPVEKEVENNESDTNEHGEKSEESSKN